MKNGVDVVVDVTYRDDKSERFICWDTPGVNPEWITLYPKTKSPMGRTLIPSAGVRDIVWDYVPARV